MKELLLLEIRKILKNKRLLLLTLLAMILALVVQAAMTDKTASQQPEQNESFQSADLYEGMIKTLTILKLHEKSKPDFNRIYEYKIQVYEFLQKNKVEEDSWKSSYVHTIPSMLIERDQFLASGNIYDAKVLEQKIDAIYSAILKNDWPGYLNNQINEMEKCEESQENIDLKKRILALRVKNQIDPVGKNWKNESIKLIDYYIGNAIFEKESLNASDDSSDEYISGMERNAVVCEEMINRNIPPSNPGTFRYFLENVNGLYMIILLYAVILAALLSTNGKNSDVDNQEYSPRYNQKDILLSKILAVNLFAVLLYVILMVFALGIGCFFFDLKDLSHNFLLMTDNNKIVSVNQIVLLLIRMGLTVPKVLTAIALTFMVGILTQSAAATSAISMFFSLAVENISTTLFDRNPMIQKFWLYSNIGIHSMPDSFSIFDPMKIVYPCFVIFVYIVFFYLVSFQGYQHKGSQTQNVMNR